jgi:hypothetical protein
VCNGGLCLLPHLIFLFMFPFLSRKAQGLPLSTIVLAIIVLVVLVVLIMIFTGYFQKWTGQASEATDRTCSEADGEERTSCLSSEVEALGYFKSLGAGKKCCVAAD